MESTKRSGSKLTLIIVLALAAIGIFYRQDITDWARLRNYNPSPEVEQLADNVGMLGDTRRLFYINRPVVADKDTFNHHCREDEHSIVLGCYLSGQNGIYLLDVTDDRLAGIEEVTAAHEVLHAAYERLSSKERARVDKMLEDAYNNLPTGRLSETIELYRKQDASEVPSELHSILGTEVRSLPDELEQYYSRYFDDRGQVVTYSEQYEQAFVERKNQIREYDLELADLKAEIDELSTQLASEDTELKGMRSQMTLLKDQGNTESYNAVVPKYNAKVNAYNSDIDELSAMIVRYNDTVQKRNSVVTEESELVKAIDSREVVPEQR